MKANLIEISPIDAQAIFVKRIEQTHFDSPFHFHEICELNHVVDSYGKRIVGDSIENFSAGDLVLMGPNLPHIWYNDPATKEKDKKTAKAIVCYFPPDFLNKLTSEESFILKIKNLVEKSKLGLRFYGETKRKVSLLVEEMTKTSEFRRVILFLEIMSILTDSDEYEPLATVNYKHKLNEKDTERMNNIYQYVMENFTEPIGLSTAAAIANMTPPAFCSFFKKRTQKSFTAFLNELRIGHACKLLKNFELPIADICYGSGYQNFTHFNSSFKKIMKTTPTQYRQELMYVDKTKWNL